MNQAPNFSTLVLFLGEAWRDSELEKFLHLEKVLRLSRKPSENVACSRLFDSLSKCSQLELESIVQCFAALTKITNAQVDLATSASTPPLAVI